MTTPNRPQLSPLAQAVVDAHYGAPAVSDTTGPRLSSTAQAVLDAALPHQVHRFAAAAALRAAADQVVPEESLHGGDQRWMFERDARQERRKKLLAIAAELELHHG